MQSSIRKQKCSQFITGAEIKTSPERELFPPNKKALGLLCGINLISLERSERMIDFSAVSADRLIKTRITRACLCGVSSGDDRCQGQTQWAWFMKYDNTETFMIIDWYC